MTLWGNTHNYSRGQENGRTLADSYSLQGKDKA